MIDCDAHGQGEKTYACQHVACGTALLWFSAAESDAESAWPDAWCEKCESVRIATDGEWTEEAMEFADIRLLCHRCYEERRDALRAGHGPEDGVAFAFRYTCGECAKEHRGLPTWETPPPIDSLDVPEADRRRARFDGDTCEVGPHRLVRTVLEIPIRGARERFVWGVWSSLSRENYERMGRAVAASREVAPMFSWLCTNLPREIYPETSGLESMLFFRTGNLRPLVVLAPADHPLSMHQQVGLTPDEAREMAARLLHRDG